MHALHAPRAAAAAGGSRPVRTAAGSAAPHSLAVGIANARRAPLVPVDRHEPSFSAASGRRGVRRRAARVNGTRGDAAAATAGAEGVPAVAESVAPNADDQHEDGCGEASQLPPSAETRGVADAAGDGDAEAAVTLAAAARALGGSTSGAAAKVAAGGGDSGVDNGRGSSSSSRGASSRASASEALLEEAAREAQWRKDRPLLPTIDPAKLAEIVFGSGEEGKADKRLERMFRMEENINAGSGPRLYVPDVVVPPDAPEAATLPLLIYLPGLDGTGLAAYRQFPKLRTRFDLRNLFVPPGDRLGFEELVNHVQGLLEKAASGIAPSRPVYLLGESFGGLLALALAERCDFIDRVVLVNPATSFADSPWPALGPALTQLPAQVYTTLPVVLSPVLANPLTMALNAINPDDPLPRKASDFLYGLLDLLQELTALRIALPAATLTHRLQVLKDGAQAVSGEPFLSRVPQRTLLLVGQLDLVIPSAQEGPRLARALPRCRLRSLPLRAHAMLQESGVDLVELLDQEGFYQPRRMLSSTTTLDSDTGSESEDADSGSAPPPARRAPVRGGAQFGRPAPLQMPTPSELDAALQMVGLQSLERLVSPVFFSTAPAPHGGEVVRGLGALPLGTGKPVLFVGNHQLLAPDMPLMIAQFLRERNTLLRGLAHPIALGGPRGGGGGGGAASPFGEFLQTFGAVPVSGTNLYRLLQQGEAALLYPGGAREANKRANEKYELLWPKRQEFVRMAARLGATIVPFAAVGAEDSVSVLGDTAALMDAPVIGPLLRARVDAGGAAARMTAARTGVNAISDDEADLRERMSLPLLAPALGGPARFYYIFREPIETGPELARDRGACDALYSHVRSECEAGISYLLRKRLQDPYVDFLPRLMYEAPSWATGTPRQAPTFEP